MKRFVIVGAMLAAYVTPAMAKERAVPASPLVTALSNCQKLSDGTARLACYDKAVPALVGASNSGDIKVVDRESVRKARRSLFGFALPSLPFFNSDDDRDAAPAKLDSKILNFSSIGNGFYRFTIADGQAVWESSEAATIGDAKAGAPVTITRGALGSYWAKIGKQREIRVRRVR